MNYPDDLPGILYYRMRAPRWAPQNPVVLTTLPRQPVRYVSTSGNTDACVVRPTIPHGAEAWSDGGPWRPLEEIPPHWLPFLQRERGTVLDPRPKPK